MFVHISAVEKAGYSNLAEGARISFELVTGRSGELTPWLMPDIGPATANRFIIEAAAEFDSRRAEPP